MPPLPGLGNVKCHLQVFRVVLCSRVLPGKNRVRELQGYGTGYGTVWHGMAQRGTAWHRQPAYPPVVPAGQFPAVLAHPGDTKGQ